MLPASLEHRINAEVDPAFARRARYILESVQQLKPHHILDAGCGRGFYVSSFAQFRFPQTIYGIDVNQEYLDAAASHINDKRVLLQQESIYELPYKNNTFDFVVSSEVMEHLSDDAAALAELRRVTKPGGTLIISVPNANYPFLWDPLNWMLEKTVGLHVPKDIWWLAGIWADHVRLYTMDQITTVAKEAGWKVVDSRSYVHHAWPASHFWLYGVGKNLVERMGAAQFNRFTNERKPLSGFLSKIVAWPSTHDPRDMKDISSVNLLLQLQK